MFVLILFLLVYVQGFLLHNILMLKLQLIHYFHVNSRNIMLQTPLNLETATTTVVPLFRSPNDFMKIAELTNKKDRAVLELIGIS